MKDTQLAYMVTVLVITMIILLCVIPKDKHSYDEIKPCNCPKVKDILYNISKYEMYVDSLNYGKKSQRERLTDSVIKYKTLLNK